MIIAMKPQATEEQIRTVCKKIEAMGFRAHTIYGVERTVVALTGIPGQLDPEEFESLPGVAEAIPITKPYKLASRETKTEDSLIQVGLPNSVVTIGGPELAVIAGPCAIESREQAFAAAASVRKAGARLFRG
jgi:3-deoxy-7-phosphoheptulonate synthase